MPIEDRNLTTGTQLAGNYKKKTYICTVETGEDGKLIYVLADGRRFKSPSSAAGAVMGGKAVNGWMFWSVASAEEGVVSAAKAEGKAKRIINRQPNQRGVEAGSTRYWCNACMKGFVVEGVDANECPEGHQST